MSDPFAVYVHWPFCAQKCPYCDFNSHVRHGGWDEPAMLAAYLAELATAARRIGPLARPVESIFFGGGTPSLMRGATVAAIIEAVGRHFGVVADCEITLEANPSSVEASRFRDYRRAGVNRVSLGVQALDDGDLKRLGRLHDAAQALAALDVAAGTFERVSFDLIYARPGQSVAAWEAELSRALELQAGHLSLYQLTIEAGTPFAALHAAGRLVTPDADLAVRLYETTQDMTAAAGLAAYEISNHARPGEESRHNLVYWRYGDYVGLGPGAHGREPRPSPAASGTAGRAATVAERNPEAWLARVAATGTGCVEEVGLTLAEQADEMLLMGLRLAEGVDLARLARRTGLAPAAGALDRLVRLGLAEPPAGGRLRASHRGRLVLNELVRRISEAFEPAAAISPSPSAAAGG